MILCAGGLKLAQSAVSASSSQALHLSSLQCESELAHTSRASFSLSHPSGLDGGRTFFNAVKEGDTVIFASDDEQDRILWVQAMYRATGQSHKPVPPTQVQKLNSRGGTAPQLDAPISQFCEFLSLRSLFVFISHTTQMLCLKQDATTSLYIHFYFLT